MPLRHRGACHEHDGDFIFDWFASILCLPCHVQGPQGLLRHRRAQGPLRHRRAPKTGERQNGGRTDKLGQSRKASLNTSLYSSSFA